MKSNLHNLLHYLYKMGVRVKKIGSLWRVCVYYTPLKFWMYCTVQIYNNYSAAKMHLFFFSHLIDSQAKLSRLLSIVDFTIDSSPL